MEENENKEITQLSREEILAISREENKNGDEREKQIYKNAIQIAYSIGLIMTGIILLVSSIIDKLPSELLIVYMGMSGTTGLYCGIKFTKHRRLFLASGIICLITCVFFIVFWILGLCGVVL